MRAKIHITLKKSVLDPQGNAISELVASKGINGVSNIRQGKYFEVDLAESNEAKATEIVDKLCQDFLANGVIEDYKFELAK